jgi:hypothetical protein
MNSPSEAGHTRLVPNRPASHPVGGITLAKASR